MAENNRKELREFKPVYSDFYDLFYQDKNYEEEANYFSSKIRKYVPHAKSILELGCGTGKHARYFVNDNFVVTGVEASSDMASKCDVSSKFTVEICDIRDFETDQKFDSIISLFHVVSYITLSEDLNKLFSKISEMLNPGGVFVFDTWFTPAVMSIGPETRSKNVQNDQVEVFRVAVPSTNVLSNTVDVTYNVFIRYKGQDTYSLETEVHKMRHFAIPEIRMFAESAGMYLAEAEEPLTGNQLSESTWASNFVLVKR